jgi:hypothetical protein
MDRREAAKWRFQRAQRERLIYLFTVVATIAATATILIVTIPGAGQ